MNIKKEIADFLKLMAYSPIGAGILTLLFGAILMRSPYTVLGINVVVIFCALLAFATIALFIIQKKKLQRISFFGLGPVVISVLVILFYKRDYISAVWSAALGFFWLSFEYMEFIVLLENNVPPQVNREKITIQKCIARASHLIKYSIIPYGSVIFLAFIPANFSCALCAIDAVVVFGTILSFATVILYFISSGHIRAGRKKLSKNIHTSMKPAIISILVIIFHKKLSCDFTALALAISLLLFFANCIDFITLSQEKQKSSDE